MSTQRSVFRVTKLSDRVHLACVRTPHRTAYTEYVRQRCLEEGVKSRHLTGEKTSYAFEAKMLIAWGDWTPCQAVTQRLVVSYDALPVVHSAFEYDIEFEADRFVRVHYAHKLPLDKKTMAPVVAAVAAKQRKRRLFGEPLGAIFRKRMQQFDWTGFDEERLRFVQQRLMVEVNVAGKTSFDRYMRRYLKYEEQVPLRAFFHGRVDARDLCLAHVRVHKELLTEAHVAQLDAIRTVYQRKFRSTAFETQVWMAPWFESDDVTTRCCVCTNIMARPVVTACNHSVMCAPCLETWLKKDNSCPMCRADPTPTIAWNKVAVWHDPDAKATETRIRDALAARKVTYVTEPVDDDEHAVVCAHPDDLLDWQANFDTEDVVLVAKTPADRPIHVYQAHNFRPKHWLTLLERWGPDQPAIIHGRVDVAPSARGSLFKSLSKCTEGSAVATLGGVATWEQRPADVVQWFTGSRKDADYVHARLLETRNVMLRSPARVRTCSRRLAGATYFTNPAEPPRSMTLAQMQRSRADAVPLHNWPGGRARVGALVVTPNTRGCAACLLRRARALCTDKCYLIAIDTDVPNATCAHAPIYDFRTTLD